MLEHGCPLWTFNSNRKMLLDTALPIYWCGSAWLCLSFYVNYTDNRVVYTSINSITCPKKSCSRMFSVIKAFLVVYVVSMFTLFVFVFTSVFWPQVFFFGCTCANIKWLCVQSLWVKTHTSHVSVHDSETVPIYKYTTYFLICTTFIWLKAPFIQLSSCSCFS